MQMAFEAVIMWELQGRGLRIPDHPETRDCGQGKKLDKVTEKRPGWWEESRKV